jgi:hypothetical protein
MSEEGANVHRRSRAVPSASHSSFRLHGLLPRWWNMIRSSILRLMRIGPALARPQPFHGAQLAQ